MTIGDFVNDALEQLGVLATNLPFLMILVLGTILMTRFTVIRNHHNVRRAITLTVTYYGGNIMWLFVSWIDLGDLIFTDKIAIRAALRSLFMTTAVVLGLWTAIPLSKLLEPHIDRWSTRLGKWFIARGERLITRQPHPTPIQPVTQEMVQEKFEELKAALLASQVKEGNGGSSA